LLKTGGFPLAFKIEVDRETCIACASCYTIDPVHFESDSEGKSRVVGGKSNGRSIGNFDDGKIADAQAAEGSCPVTAIKVTET
jgi:ferredoxin